MSIHKTYIIFILLEMMQMHVHTFEGSDAYASEFVVLNLTGIF